VLVLLQQVRVLPQVVVVDGQCVVARPASPADK
jgi:hypothetical protein